jgi:hypothetical protein
MFVPAAGSHLIVALPGESLRCTVRRVVDPDTAIVELPQPLTRNHTYRRGDIVACERTSGMLGETWTVMELRAATLPAGLEAEPPAEKPVTDRKPRPEKRPVKPAKKGKI